MPDDADAVISAIRLGWALAEVRGRYRPDGPRDLNWGSMPEGDGHPLPLASQRTPEELLTQALGEVAALAAKLGVQRKPGDEVSYPRRLEEHGNRLTVIYENREDPKKAWLELSELIYQFDAFIQDGLAASSYPQAAGYQLGRGLAESFWALNPGDADGPAGWLYLLDERCGELQWLAKLVSGYMAPSAGAAIAGSLSVWRAVASDPAWRGDGEYAREMLLAQIEVWRVVAILALDPMEFSSPYAKFRNGPVIARAVRLFGGRLILGLAGVAGLVTLIVTLGTGVGGTLANALLAVVAGAGLSVGGLSAKRFAQAVTEDRAALAITRVMPPPRKGDFTRAFRRR